MIYLDNAATTDFKPQCVIDAVTEAITKYPFNPNRGGHKQALELERKLYQTRKKLSLLCHNDSEKHVAFTGGCTEALNLAILGNAKRGHVIVSCYEHNSVLRPLMQLKKRGFITVSVAQADENGDVRAEEIERLLQKDTYMICVSHASNVNGKSQRLYDLGELARQKNLLFLVDCAQSVGYFPIDMSKCNVDMVALAGHKGLHGIQGAGALVFNERATPRPVKFGGTGSESHLYYQPDTIPDSLESGTLPCPAIMAMDAGIDYWLENWQTNSERIAECEKLIADGLKAVPNVKLYSQSNKSGIVAFNVGNTDSNEIADELSAEYDIAVRGGLQCAPLAHKYLGTFEQGIVRASVSCVTTKDECYRFLNAVDTITRKLSR